MDVQGYNHIYANTRVVAWLSRKSLRVQTKTTSTQTREVYNGYMGIALTFACPNKFQERANSRVGVHGYRARICMPRETDIGRSWDIARAQPIDLLCDPRFIDRGGKGLWCAAVRCVFYRAFRP